MSIQTVEELLLRELKDIEDAEVQASKAIQAYVGNLEDGRLRRLLEQRLHEGQRVLSDIRSCLERLEGDHSEPRNEAARGLIAEAEKIVQQTKSAEVRQAAIIAAVQKLEHYCIASWGTVRALAKEIGEKELVERMQGALDEGYRWDRQMSELAQRRINPAASADTA